jgi:hypothetical protein
MLDDLGRHSLDLEALRDRLPYVLDLLAGVRRTIRAESRGRPTPTAMVTCWKWRPITAVTRCGTVE